jgi:ankyrin repeat protein
LLNAGANCSDVQGGLGRTPLLAALAYGNEEAVKLMVEAGAELNTQGGEIAVMSPLMLAASRGLEKATTWLLDGGARVNDLSRDARKTALDYAIEQKHAEIVHVLRTRGAKRSIELEK